MSKQPETLFKEKVLEALKELPNCWAEKMQQVATHGTPDIIACISGHYVALELKRSDFAKIGQLQKYVIGRVNDAGGHGFIVHPDNWAGVYKFLKRLADNPKS